MRAIARQRENLVHDVKVGDHQLTVDEPVDSGGDDEGPSPQELLAAALASCTAITMEMYAKRKGWDIERPARSTSTTRPPSAAARRASTSCARCRRTSTRSRSSGCG